MDKHYRPQNFERQIYQQWEKAGYFTPKIDQTKKPFTIIMPPPNANGALHIGHALFVTLQDILIRYHRMRGKPTLWLPGADHAGILTQVVFEKKLEKEEGKSRYDLGRQEFFRRCMKFTLTNKKTMEEQLKRLGASCDWSRSSFTLDPKFNQPIYTVFQKLHQQGLLYRDLRLVNWCPRCQTALSDLEVIHQTKTDPLYYLRYGELTVATVRPETKFGDTALAVNPNDKRYQKLIGREIKVTDLLGQFKLKVIADLNVDPSFGTGVVKVTPAHDPIDYEMGQKHKLEIRQVIDFNGRLNHLTGPYQGLTVKKARQIVVADLAKKGLLVKTQENYQHAVAVCERCKTTIEPMISLQWFIKTKPLAQKAIQVVKKGLIKFIPSRFTKNYFIWLNKIKDWCISRQLWWGHQLPVYYCGSSPLSALQKAMNPQLEQKSGCGQIIVAPTKPKKCPVCADTNLIQDPDTLDTWFSSGQWPYTTLNWGQKDQTDFNYFYPTSVMETGYEILFFWVARMIMLGLFATNQIPFAKVYLHGLVRDAFGEKMSKSKGNVINPLTMIDKYGADALRLALVFGTAAGNDSKIGEAKVAGMRNFTNKIWNIGRFFFLTSQSLKETLPADIHKLTPQLTKEDQLILNQLNTLTKKVTQALNNFKLNTGLELIYQFLWHRLADWYLEIVKKREDKKAALAVFRHVYLTSLKLLHPYAPFVTEAIWQILGDKNQPLIINDWPKN